MADTRLRGILSWLLVILPAVGWLAAPSLLQAGSRVLFDFRNTSQGWRAEIPETGEAPAFSLAARAGGDTGLRISAEFPGETEIWAPLNEDWRFCERLSFEIAAPRLPSGGIRCLVYLKTGDGRWYQSRLFRLQSGSSRRLEYDLTSSSTDWQPHGHSETWSDSALYSVERIGLKFFGTRVGPGLILLDDFRVAGRTLTFLEQDRKQTGLYERFELTFGLDRSFENPFDTDLVRIDAHFLAPSGREWVVPAFFYQGYEFEGPGRNSQDRLIPVGVPVWKARFSPVEIGRHRCFLEISLDKGAEKFRSPVREFEAVVSGRRGFLRVNQRDRRHFAFDDGTSFYPIGHNIRSLNDNRYAGFRRAPLAASEGTLAMEDWLKSMAANGENFFETWMAAWWLALEWKKDSNYEPNNFYEGIGRYNLRNAWKLDWILEHSEALGIYIQLLIVNHGSCSTFCDQEWNDNPYNRKNGGFLDSPDDFFRDPEARRLFQQRLRYIVGRWGYSPNIFAWELLNEMNLVGASGAFYQTPGFRDWYQVMIDYLKETDPWGHLVTGHYTILYDSDVFKLPEVAYTLTNAYYGGRNGLAATLSNAARFLERFDKPHFVSEYGGSSGGGDEDLLKADLHNGLWIGYHLPFAAPPLFWWHNFIEEQNLFFHYRALANYAAGEDRSLEKLVPARVALNGEGVEKTASFCLKGSRRAFIWFYDQGQLSRLPAEDGLPFFKQARASLEGLESGDYRLEFWDTYRGVIFEERRVKGQGRLEFDLPPVNRDFAVKIKPLSNP